MVRKRAWAVTLRVTDWLGSHVTLCAESGFSESACRQLADVNSRGGSYTQWPIITVRTCMCIVRRDGLELQKIVALITRMPCSARVSSVVYRSERTWHLRPQWKDFSMSSHGSLRHRTSQTGKPVGRHRREPVSGTARRKIVPTLVLVGVGAAAAAASAHGIAAPATHADAISVANLPWMY
jgi:hypothetical protein